MFVSLRYIYRYIDSTDVDTFIAGYISNANASGRETDEEAVFAHLTTKLVSLFGFIEYYIKLIESYPTIEIDKLLCKNVNSTIEQLNSRIETYIDGQNNLNKIKTDTAVAIQ
jgi:hypothetical protein